jgi:hypothetical protein
MDIKLTDIIKEVLMEHSYHYNHKDYRMLEGNDNITVAFNDGSRLKFEVHFHNNHKEDKEKWRKKAASKWKTLASKIHGDVRLTDACNPVQKTWRQSFEEALEHPELQEYIRKNSHQKIFDPVNFSPRV